MDTEKIKDEWYREIVLFHSDAMEKARFPSTLNIEDLSQHSDNCHFFPSAAEAEIFFLLDERSALPGLEFPVIKQLSVLEQLSADIADRFAKYLRGLGDSFLVLMESYNKAGIKLLSKLRPKETYFCQQKYLCPVNGLHTKIMTLPSGIRIRNFIQDRDEERYADFYNQVLGFLAGKPVDRSFVDGITARASFNPRGYFIAEDENGMAGFISIEKEPWGEPGSGFGYIYQIGVAEKWQSSGLAALLLDKAKGFALDYRIDRIGVGVRGSNKPAIRFFKKYSFQTAYTIEGYLLDLN